jgi:hypothetical protein
VKRSKRRADTLQCEEWFFVNVHEDKKKSAFIYEYGRELTRRGVLTFDSILKSTHSFVIRMPPRGRTDYQKLMRDHLPDFVRITGPLFPDTPWRLIDSEMQAALVSAAKKRFPEDMYLREFTVPDVQSYGVTDEAFLWAKQPLANNQCIRQTPVGLEINFDNSDTAILAAIAEWLPKERKRLGLPEVKFKPKTGRGTFSDRLNGLGALRLVNHHATEPNRLIEYTKAKLGYDGGCFQNVRELRDAACKAEELLKLLSGRSGN